MNRHRGRNILSLGEWKVDRAKGECEEGGATGDRLNAEGKRETEEKSSRNRRAPLELGNDVTKFRHGATEVNRCLRDAEMRVCVDRTSPSSCIGAPCHDFFSLSLSLFPRFVEHIERRAVRLRIPRAAAAAAAQRRCERFRHPRQIEISDSSPLPSFSSPSLFSRLPSSPSSPIASFRFSRCLPIPFTSGVVTRRRHLKVTGTNRYSEFKIHRDTRGFEIPPGWYSVTAVTTVLGRFRASLFVAVCENIFFFSVSLSAR